MTTGTNIHVFYARDGYPSQAVVQRDDGKQNRWGPMNQILDFKDMPSVPRHLFFTFIY